MITREWLAGICSKWKLFPPASQEQIDAAQAELQLHFPREYVEFLLSTNGMRFFDLTDPPSPLSKEQFELFYGVADLLTPDRRLHDLGKVVFENCIYEAPGCLVIGQDGIEGPIFLHLGMGNAQHAPVYAQQVEDFGINEDGVHELYGRKAKSLTEWLAAGCPLPDPVDDENLTRNGFE